MIKIRNIMIFDKNNKNSKNYLNLNLHNTAYDKKKCPSTCNLLSSK